ncbi:MAG: SDR family NAD(P)-dependent oxidoreductase [Rhodospirillaceae bacterium]|nr:SDR family NAD(P)-dependent oxidoreductase [Rhodospirillaceae bacterium]
MTQTPSVVWIVGASRGIGAAAAAAFFQAGYAVALSARSLDACRSVAERLDPSGTRARAYRADVADADMVAEAASAVLGDFGRLDVLINCAGVIEPIARFGKAAPAAWARSIQINLVGAYAAIHAALPALRDSQGAVINVSSGAAGNPLEGWSAYCAGKAGLAMLTRSIALEEGPGGIRAFGFRPGVVDTEMQVAIRASGINRVSQLRREDLAPPEEPARFMVWLASGAGDDLSGEEIDVRDPDLRQRAGLPALG